MTMFACAHRCLPDSSTELGAVSRAAGVAGGELPHGVLRAAIVQPPTVLRPADAASRRNDAGSAVLAVGIAFPIALSL